MKIEHINLICKLVWSYNRLTGIDYDELFSEACLGYAEALVLYNPESNTKFSTFCWSVIRNKLRIYIRKQKKTQQQIPFSDLSEDTIFALFTKNQAFVESEEEPASFDDFLKTLNNDARFIAELVVEKHNTFPQDKPAYHLRQYVRDALRNEGWSWPRIWKGIKSLKMALNH